MAARPSNLTFDSSRTDEIHRGNEHLLDRLHSIATRRPASSAAAGAGRARAGPSSAEITRRRAAAEIERQNMLMLRRLQSTKSAVGKVAPTAKSSSRPVTSSAGAGAGFPASPASASSGVDFAATGSPSRGAGRPAWVDPTSSAPPPSRGADFVRAAGATAGTAGKSGPPERAMSAKQSVYGRASLGGSARVGGRVTGVPPSRGGPGERDTRDLLLSACRDDYLTR